MGIGRIHRLDGVCVPDLTIADPAIPVPLSAFLTNDVVCKHDVWQFGGNNAAQPTLLIPICGFLTAIPDDFDSAPAIEGILTATITSGNFRIGFRYRITTTTGSLDNAAWQESDEVTVAAPAAAGDRCTFSISPSTPANFIPGRSMQFEIFRDGADASDDVAGSLFLLGADLTYTTI